MREIQAADIIAAVSRLAIEANTLLGDDVVAALRHALDVEESPAGRDVLGQILENARLAREEHLPLCQDTGRVTSLAVHLEVAPCHIASLPVAVNVWCHSARHKTAVL